jgi:cytosine/adenosine deaminase-related metal-dependent hydrolase
MTTLLIQHIDLIATFDDAGTRITDGAIYVVDNLIEQIGPTEALPQTADRILDGQGLIIIPGLVNTHHHFFQTLTRCLAQNHSLFGWLNTLYPLWCKLTPEAIYISTQVAIAELILSGCTTSSDHTYIWPNGARLDDQIQAAQELGFRFHATRGSMSIGQSQGGLPPDHSVETDAAILKDSQRLIETYHDSNHGSMLQIVLAPCSPFSVTLDLMRESIKLARHYGVHSHTHLAETLDEERYCLANYGCRPIELAEKLEWVGPDVWHAHLVHPSDSEVQRLGQTQTGVAHCPCSNMRLASGIAPIPDLIRANARVGLGVDGSASNDGSHLLNEARQALLLHRVLNTAATLSPYQALELATRGGARVLGRHDIGFLAPGMCADLVGFRLNTLGFAGGAVHDPIAALVLCQPPQVDLSVINGQVRVEAGQLLGIELPSLIERHNAIATALVAG